MTYLIEKNHLQIQFKLNNQCFNGFLNKLANFQCNCLIPIEKKTLNYNLN